MNELCTLTDIQARKLCAKINAGIEDVTNLVIQFYRGGGWSVLGYGSWTECCREEFGKSAAWASRQVKVFGKLGLQDASLSSHLPERELEPEKPLAVDPEQSEPDESSDSSEAIEAPEIDAGESEEPIATGPSEDWLRDTAEELCFATGNREMVAMFLDSIADWLRVTKPAVAMARLENVAVVIRKG